MRSDARAPERGFTLLEIVCTLVILGVLGSLVFSGFGTAITGYTQMREVGTSDMQAELRRYCLCLFTCIYRRIYRRKVCSVL